MNAEVGGTHNYHIALKDQINQATFISPLLCKKEIPLLFHTLQIAKPTSFYYAFDNNVSINKIFGPYGCHN